MEGAGALEGNGRARDGVEPRDALVVGGNIAGLTVGYFLAQNGYRPVVLERAPQVGGIDRSFTNRNGRVFDHGLHVLDYMRSELTTRLFRHVLRDECRLIERRRAICLRSHLIPYNAPASEWPAELRALLPGDGELVDFQGTEPPTRTSLARWYGEAFTALVFDETLPSYPSECRHREFGVPEAELMSAIYPWFFPRARRERVALDRSREYQDRVRERPKEYFLYPQRGGFGAFAEAFRARIEEQGGEVLTGARDLDLDLEPERQRVRAVTACGRRFDAPRVYWCAPGAVLARLLGRETHDGCPDRFRLGSFELSGPTTCAFNEVIVGDPQHRVNRITFPGKQTLEGDDLVQIEFAHPKDDERHDLSEGAWMESWLESLRRVGIVGRGVEVVDFDLKTFDVLYNSYGVDGRRMPEIDLGELHPESNLVPVLPTIRKVNINTRVPQYLEFLAADLQRRPASP